MAKNITIEEEWIRSRELWSEWIFQRENFAFI